MYCICNIVWHIWFCFVPQDRMHCCICLSFTCGHSWFGNRKQSYSQHCANNTTFPWWETKFLCCLVVQSSCVGMVNKNSVSCLTEQNSTMRCYCASPECFFTCFSERWGAWVQQFTVWAYNERLTQRQCSANLSGKWQMFQRHNPMLFFLAIHEEKNCFVCKVSPLNFLCTCTHTCTCTHHLHLVK